MTRDLSAVLAGVNDQGTARTDGRYCETSIFGVLELWLQVPG